MDEHQTCVRITPRLAAHFAKIARKAAEDFSKAAERLSSVTSLEDSHDPFEDFLQAIAGPVSFADRNGAAIAIAKVAGGIMGTNGDEEALSALGLSELNPDPIPDVLKNLLQSEATDFPQAEA